MRTRIRSVSTITAIILLIICIGFVLWNKRDHSQYMSIHQSKPLCKDCNIVLLTLDVCSARNIPCYGYDRNTTPNLCAFAKENQLFLNSFANAPWTFPSHASIMTGLLPTHHGVNIQYKDTLSPSIPLLTEVLQQHGYETTLFQHNNSAVLPLDIYKRGVSEVIDDDFRVARIFTLLDENSRQGKKSFISYYTSECHEPNRVGSTDKKYTTDSYPGIPIDPDDESVHFTPEFFAYLKKNLPKKIEAKAYNNKSDKVKLIYDQMMKSKSFDEAKSIFMNDTIVSDHEILYQMYWSYIYEEYIDVKNKKMMDYLRALYDQQLYQQDENDINDFVTRLKSSKQKNNTIVLISSQHGQEFGEHGVYGHTTLYEGNARVPFILSVPRVTAHTYTYPVSGVDIMPTLLDLVGIQTDAIFDGKSIAPLLNGKTMKPRLIIAEQDEGARRTIRKGKWKVFIKMSGATFIPYELYDTEYDPNESINLLASNIDIANTLIEEYKQQYIRQ